MALVTRVMYVCMKRELCRGMHLLPHPFFMSSSLDQSVSSSASQVTDFQTPLTSHPPLTSYCGEDPQEKLIILYYSWIEPKGTCRSSSLHFLFLYLPRVFDSGAFVCSPVKCQIFGGEAVVAVVFLTAASQTQSVTNTSSCTISPLSVSWKLRSTAGASSLNCSTFSIKLEH